MSRLQDKLYNYEQTPPAKVWDQIAAALDETHIGDEFPSKLYNAEVPPPAGAWDKIAGALEPAHAIPMRTRSFSFLRYAAAAALIGLIAFGVVKWMNAGNSTDTDVAIHSGNTDNGSDTSTSLKKDDTDPGTQPDNMKREDVTNEPPSTEVVRTNPVKKSRSVFAVSNDPDDTEAIYAYNEHTPNLADRYIMYMTPDGDIVRMSKKWGDLVCCVSGQDQDENCKDQIKKWQEKLACAPVANGNFMDIFSLVSTLNTDL